MRSLSVKELRKAGVDEAAVQKAIVEYFMLTGLTVRTTDRHRRRCRQCGAWPSGGDGVSKGVADLLVRSKYWPEGIWLALEVKGPGTKVSPEQKALEQKGAIFIVRSIEDAVRAIKHADLAIKSTPPAIAS